MAKIQRALLSVTDKKGIFLLAQGLQKYGVEILSTGGTAQFLRQQGISVIEVSDYTHHPEVLEGRVKTLHPKIHGGILGKRDNTAHREAMLRADIPNIDLVVVNLYPFQMVIAQADCSLKKAIENIDIGGPAMIRSAAKNYEHVAIITDPKDYEEFLEELARNDGETTLSTRFMLAQKAFAYTAQYDGAISNYLSRLSLSVHNEWGTAEFPETYNIQFQKKIDLRYGENPHQQGVFYQDLSHREGSISHFTQLQGKALSYNNITDGDFAWECVKAFTEPACVIVKHANPCGIAIAEDIALAYQKALTTDPVSVFGGIIAVNSQIDTAFAQVLIEKFVEVIIAPSVTLPALAIFSSKPNVRVLTIPLMQKSSALDYKRVGGGLLVQTEDVFSPDEFANFKVVSQKQPSPEQIIDLQFAWKVAKFVKSNAIVFCKNGQTLGIGAGQMSRVDSTKIAILKAHEAGLSLQNSVVASDAFFPFQDGVQLLINAGANCVAHPGGGMRDAEIIKLANDCNIIMVLTGVRHFRH